MVVRPRGSQDGFLVQTASSCTGSQEQLPWIVFQLSNGAMASMVYVLEAYFVAPLTRHQYD